jgi:transcriptional regulator with XRE-family HTH domain
MTSRQEDRLFKKFGQRCRQIRIEKGLTQEAMAYRGFSTRFYQRIEAGKPVHLRTVFKLAKALKVPVADLFKNL